MSKGVVFKQPRHKAVKASAKPDLNRKHLIYIATRKGAIHNEGCNFGLWGKLPNMVEAKNIDDFTLAKKTVAAFSKGHVIWRGILSVDGETAEKHGLYERRTWQDIVTRKIDILAEQRGIAKKDFCWVASMHYAKNHPHVHIMYWDKSSQIHQEFLPKERFEILAGRVRSTFGREVYREELAELRAETKGITEQARLELCTMCREANLSEALNLDHVPQAKLDELGKGLAGLAVSIPDRGSLKYAYLPDSYKEKVNVFLDSVLMVSDFSRLQAKYIKLTDEISTLYGNGEEQKGYNRDAAMKKLYTSMGNSVMGVIKEYRAELSKSIPEGLDDLRAAVEAPARKLAQGNPNYQKLLHLMPKERTPMKVISETEGFQERKDKLVKELCRDIRIQALFKAYVDTSWGKEGHSGSEAHQKEERNAFTAGARRDLYRLMDGIVRDQLQEDAGYRQQQSADAVLMSLLRMFRDFSQGTNQSQSQRDLLRLRPHRELSKTARMERQKQREQEGGWTL